MNQLQALLLTLLIEVPVVMGIAALGRWTGQRRRLLVVACACSLLTHPFAWNGMRAARLLVPALWPRALVIEGLVALVEGLLYARVAGLGYRRGLLLGFVANAVSYLLGLVLLHHWPG